MQCIDCMFLAIYAVYGLHIIAHHYFDIDESIVFDVIKNKLPGMLETINKMIDESKAKNRLYGDLCKRIRNVQIQSADTLTFFFKCISHNSSGIFFQYLYICHIGLNLYNLYISSTLLFRRGFLYHLYLLFHYMYGICLFRHSYGMERIDVCRLFDILFSVPLAYLRYHQKSMAYMSRCCLQTIFGIALC